jgi:hypothetical protein
MWLGPRFQHTLTATTIFSWGIFIQACVTILSWIVEISVAHGFVMFCGVMFSEIISAIEGALFPVYDELTLADAITTQ